MISFDVFTLLSLHAANMLFDAILLCLRTSFLRRKRTQWYKSFAEVK
jgi:hypothetical protein